MLLSRRSGLESNLRTELRRAWPRERVMEVDVGPLDAGELHRPVRDDRFRVVPANIRTPAATISSA